ncbi:dual specificity protein phosphatase 18 [Xiphias gladius]|uniref:dual specificity protein phosphatase 18 n=1 Tax=Xiphias gladius TaxID=8245 RepID=UPI001A9A08F9|nr:dual specificity protein phosphatase 18 [Xiphias gladius]
MSVSQITPTLFLGGADAPLNAALVSQKGITLIVNATLSHACPAYPGVECVRVAVSDLPSARLGDHFDRVAERIHGNRAGGTLVHCAAGMSRSPALVMAYLMRYRGVTLRQAHRWVRDSRPHVRLNVGFWDQLLQYERRLYGKNTVRVAAVDETSAPPSPLMARATAPRRQKNRSTLAPRSPPLTRTSLTTGSHGTTRAPVMTQVNKSRRGTKSSSAKVGTLSPRLSHSNHK